MQVAAALEMSIQTQKRDLLALNKAHNEQIKQFSKLTSENHRDENPQFQRRIMLPTQNSQIEAQNEFIQPIDIKDDDLPISDYISDFSDSKQMDDQNGDKGERSINSIDRSLVNYEKISIHSKIKNYKVMNEQIQRSLKKKY